MNYNNILLIGNTYIVLKTDNQKYCVELSKDIIKNGVICNYELFIQKYISIFNKNKLSKLFWNKDIKIIYNVLNNKKDVEQIYNSFKDLNYRKVVLISEKNYLDVNKKNSYLIYDKIIRLLYIDKYNTKKILILDREIFLPHEIKQLIFNRCQNKNLIIIGCIDKELISEKLDYYYYEDFNEFFLENNL